MSRTINTELKSDSDLDSEKVGVKSDAEIMAKSETGPDSELDIIVHK